LLPLDTGVDRDGHQRVHDGAQFNVPARPEHQTIEPSSKVASIPAAAG
jgi:hypothetical protein